ncbi:amino acid adenylation domain-containing protein [Schaedlerella arabinosiphila]|uniref:Amino acid adenylation domain-containing protein n=1 Tax=Schaedlerella arabinosiphila TaxID=2044587 RepID=A0A9X5C6I3_9FIRM|nr:amino acid adenylation domain-containing protein [Schaedlerella arabinosiphila]KAI4441736.1 Tyrocidine synthase 3 [Schaedlerella arabinosiphila]NDO68687.1 amino acid adenylation domain-containing protein [Schaedlerella arabinosiphila]
MQANVLEWLEDSSQRFGNKLAICDDREEMTYLQYHQKAIGLAKAVINSGLTAREPVVVYLEKSVRVLASFMGIAFAGNFYSPIDIGMPKQRVNRILEVLQPELVITSKELKEEFQSFNYQGNYIIYEDVVPIAEDANVERRKRQIIDTDLLYVLFTSGSTGNPKGVSITHRGVIDYIDWITKTFKIKNEDCFGNQAPFYFDNSILDIYSTMKMGATLYIIPVNLFAQPIKLLKYIRNNKISTIFWVPSALIIVSKLRAFKNVDLTDVLKRVLFCGEVMPNKHLNIWREYLPNIEYANLYGPTEITDACTYYIVDREFADCDPLPIGFPMDNTGILVLDEKDHLVEKPGKIGELCVRGTGISVGYYNDIEKTKKAFVQNPLNHAFEEKIYRTGDLVEYNEYGELVYLSRKDFQIKHLGHRIELGEIENAVSSLSGISRCCCLYDEKHGRITLFLDKDISKNELHSYLANMIPEYMIPGKVIYIQNLPLNANGKIDRVKLKEYL